MQNDNRQNPRFIAAKGVPARVLIAGREMTGLLQNFSSTGLAVIVDEAPDEAFGMSLDLHFSTTFPPVLALHLSAEVVNVFISEGRARLGCRITEMHGQGEAYFAFLTKMMFSQGLIKSMATKPVKYRGE